MDLGERKQKILTAIIEAYIPVSYTHLDVYKRQAGNDAAQSSNGGGRSRESVPFSGGCGQCGFGGIPLCFVTYAVVVFPYRRGVRRKSAAVCFSGRIRLALWRGRAADASGTYLGEFSIRLLPRR